ncbi:MAG TPA: heat-inducible transcriptional repressor HrcA [Chloroflexota bacterium]
MTERQEDILKTIVKLYISSAHPVGSSAIVSASGLHVSSATVRNEMAILEELGYVRQLHTSGGRVPTNAGYRYYVERLMERARLPYSETSTIRHQFHQAHTEVQEWLKLAATIMAHRMHTVGLVTAPRSTEARLRHLEVIGIQNSIALLIVVVQDGTVLQEMVTLQDAESQEDLSIMADRLSAQLRGLTWAEIDAKAVELAPVEMQVAMIAAHLLRRAQGQNVQIFHAGLADMIRQPEFLGPRRGEPASLTNERLRQMVDFLQQGLALQRLLSYFPPDANLQILIGGETTVDGLQDYSFVLGRYGHEEDSSGYLGIVGPTRMEYQRAVALVQYMTDLMTDLVRPY